MASKLFEGLKESILDAGKFLRGEPVEGLTLHTVSIAPVEELEGKDLKRIRAKYGLSQGALAEIVGVSRKTVEAWEHDGTASKPVSRILQLIEAQPQLMSLLVEDKPKKAMG